MIRLLALDPGGTTGFSCWQYDALTPLTLLSHGQIEGGLDGFLWWLDGRERPYADEIVSESFVLDGRGGVSVDVTPLRIEGAMRVVFGPNVIYQRNIYKSHAPDSLLKYHDLWFVGQEHARDSARHAIALMKVRKHAPTLRKLWPPQRPAIAA